MRRREDGEDEMDEGMTAVGMRGRKQEQEQEQEREWEQGEGEGKEVLGNKHSHLSDSLI